MMKDFSTFPVRHNAAKIAFVYVEMNILLCGHCTLFITKIVPHLSRL